jgi:Flp pilus assembly protein TadG
MAKHIGVANLLRRLAPKPPGQTFLLVSIALVVVIGMASLAVDVGNLWTTRRLMQSAADSGAVAGADEMAIGGTSTTIAAAAKDAASHNGFADGSSRAGGTGTVTVSVHNPPTSGAYAANANAVEVDVSQTQSTYFMRVLGWKSVPVSTTAVAVILGSGSCVYGLDLTASPTVSVGGTASVNSACGLYVNSYGSGALTVSGGGTITAPVVGVVGGTNVNGVAARRPRQEFRISAIRSPTLRLRPVRLLVRSLPHAPTVVFTPKVSVVPSVPALFVAASRSTRGTPSTFSPASTSSTAAASLLLAAEP